MLIWYLEFGFKQCSKERDVWVNGGTRLCGAITKAGWWANEDTSVHPIYLYMLVIVHKKVIIHMLLDLYV